MNNPARQMSPPFRRTLGDLIRCNSQSSSACVAVRAAMAQDCGMTNTVVEMLDACLPGPGCLVRMSAQQQV